MTDITEFLRDAAAGKKEVVDKVFPLLESELHQAAARLMSKERRDHTLQPTALLHEAYIRLVNQKTVDYRGRSHFIAIMVKKMREVLLDRGRKTDLDLREAVARIPVSINDRNVEMLALMEALEKLRSMDEDLYDVLTKRLLGGMTTAELAKERGQSMRSVQLHLQDATMILLAELDGVSM